ncbi:MAG: hypothetical protein AAB480_04485 [Patescibacteria group bacterium]
MDWHALVSVFSNIPLDWVVIAVFAFVMAADALRGGPSRATALALALPLTLLVAGALPDARLMGGIASQLTSPLLGALFDGILLVIVFICMYRITDTYGADSSHPIQALFSGVAVAAIAVVIWLQIPALDSVWHFGPQIQALFGDVYRFWWLLIAYIALAFARG